MTPLCSHFGVAFYNPRDYIVFVTLECFAVGVINDLREAIVIYEKRSAVMSVFTREMSNLLIAAIDLKCASIKRASKAASPAFQVLYDKELSEYTVLASLVREHTYEAPSGQKK